MKRKINYKIISCILAFSISIPFLSLGIVHADEDEVPDADTAIAENYWGELEKEPLLDGGIYPKHLMKLQASALKNFDLASGGNSPSSGAYKNFNTLAWAADMDMFNYFSNPERQDNEGANGDPDYQDNKYHNPFKFDFNTDFIKDRDQLNVYGDISVNGNTEHNSVATHAVGDELKLDFSVNLSNLSKWQNTRFWFDINGHSKGQLWKLHGTEGYVATDSELVFVLNIPRGITIPDVNSLRFTVEGLNSLKFKKAEKVGDKLIIRVHPTLNSEGYMKAKDYYAHLKTIGTIKVKVEGLLVNNEVAIGQDVSITGSVVGVNDDLVTDSIDVAKNKVGSGSDDVRSAYFFVGKQSNEGRDANAPADKPNLISYTFKVTKAPDNPYRPHRPDVPNPGRIDGPDRIETGINISKKYYDKAKTVIVVRHDLFPDSMTASVLAKLKDAPILLNPTNKLDPRVAAEIKRLGAEEVIIVGGPDSISEKVRGDLKVYDKDKDVERIAGVDRYGTSEMVARRVVGITGKKYTGVVASGQVFPDALSVGTFASRDGYPILLVKKDMVPNQVERAIKDLEIKKTYIAGGTNTISKLTEAKLPSVVERMAGRDRYETSVAIAKSKFKDSRDAFIASGEEFADALVISPVSGKYNRPTLLASRNKTSNALVKKYISDTRIHGITAIGGERYLPYSILLDLVGK